MKAIVFVDVQNDFVTGPLGSGWAQNVVPEIVKFANTCKAAGHQLFATRDTHDLTYPATLEGRRLAVKHCEEGTDGWQIVPELMDVLLGSCTFVNKPTFGSYDLIECIAERFDLKELENAPDDKIQVFDEIVICGFCTSICVLANAVLLRAKFPNMKITVVKDLCADVTKEAHETALAAFKAQNIDVI